MFLLKPGPLRSPGRPGLFLHHRRRTRAVVAGIGIALGGADGGGVGDGAYRHGFEGDGDCCFRAFVQRAEGAGDGGGAAAAALGRFRADEHTISRERDRKSVV